MTDSAAPTTKDCPTCDGKGTILEGNRDCPDCNATGKIPVESKSAHVAGTSRRKIPLTTVETRSFNLSDVQIRTSDDGTTSHFSGYASTTDQPYDVQDFMGSYAETIRSGAFTKTLREGSNVPLLFNHGGLPIASTAGGTMTLTEDRTGLKVDADLDRRQSVTSDICIALERGDLSQMSFSFAAVKDSWSPDYCKRDVNEARLFDASVVTYPANPGTTASLRADLQVALGTEGRARLLEVSGIMTELRTGKSISAANAELLQNALDALGSADSAHDAAKGAINSALDSNAAGDDDNDDAATSSSSDGSVKGSSEGLANGGSSAAGALDNDGAGPRSQTPVAEQRKYTPISAIETRALLHELERAF
jgi:HK97 family phage prohead protease